MWLCYDNILLLIHYRAIFHLMKMEFVMEVVCLFIKTDTMVFFFKRYNKLNHHSTNIIVGNNISSVKIGDVVGDQLTFVYVDTESHSTVWPGLLQCLT